MNEWGTEWRDLTSDIMDFSQENIHYVAKISYNGLQYHEILKKV